MATHLASGSIRVYMTPMKYAFDMDDKARLPWRFHGEQQALWADL